MFTIKGGKESGRRTAAVPGLIPSLLTHWAVRPAARARSTVEKNMADQTVCLPRRRPESIASEPGTHGVRAPESSLPRPGRYAEAAGVREGARGLLGLSGRRFSGGRSGVGIISGPRRSGLAAGLFSFVGFLGSKMRTWSLE